MNRLLLLSLLAVMACGGKLSDEERKKLHEGMSTQDIRRVTDAELQEAATQYGTALMDQLVRRDPYLRNQVLVDSFRTAYQVDILALTPNATQMKEIEKQLVEAYLSGLAAGTASDNLQRLGNDSLLFTRPVFKDLPDGSQEFVHAIGIRMARRTVVLSLGKN